MRDRLLCMQAAWLRGTPGKSVLSILGRYLLGSTPINPVRMHVMIANAAIASNRSLQTYMHTRSSAETAYMHHIALPAVGSKSRT